MNTGYFARPLLANIGKHYSKKFGQILEKNYFNQTLCGFESVSDARFIKTSNEKLSFIELDFQNGVEMEHLRIPMVWFRDHCRNSANYNTKTNQRRSSTTDLFERARLSQTCQSPVIFDPSLQLLKIYWDDANESQFKSSDILEWALFKQKGDECISRTLWSRNDLKEVPSISSKNFDFATLARLFIQFGVVSVVGVDSTNQEVTRELCESIAPYCNTIFDSFWTFGVEAKTQKVEEEVLVREDTAYSNEAIGPHTDGTYFEHPPGIQVFHCLKSASSGGETLLVDGFSAAGELKKNYTNFFEILSQTPIEHHYLEGCDEGGIYNKEGRQIYAKAMQSPVIRLLGDEITHIRYNPYDRAPLRCLKLGQGSNSQKSLEKIVEFYEAYEKFSQIINCPHNVLRVLLEPGTVIFIDNFRVLHGRSAFEVKYYALIPGVVKEHSVFYRVREKYVDVTCLVMVS